MTEIFLIPRFAINTVGRFECFKILLLLKWKKKRKTFQSRPLSRLTNSIKNYYYIVNGEKNKNERTN